MKNLKITFLFRLFTLIHIFNIFISCNKNEVYSSANAKIDKLNNELKALNAKYFHKDNLLQSTVNFKLPLQNNTMLLQNSSRINNFALGGAITTPPTPIQPISVGFTFKKFCAVFSADVSGGWSGAWAGGKIGSCFGNPVAGAVAGGIIVGAAASYAASDVVSDTTLNLLPTPTPFTPTSEESAYEGHNRILNLLISSSANVPESIENQNLFNSTYLTNNELTIVSSCQNLINNTTTTFSNPQIRNSKVFVAENIEDNFITTVSNNFFDGLEYLQTPQEVSNFIDSYESYINNSPNLTQEQKQYIEVALKTSRGSLAFWSPLIGH